MPEKPRTSTGVDGPARFDWRAGVGDQRSHAAPLGAGHHQIADVQRSALDQHGGDGTAATIEFGLDHGAFCGTIRVGLEVEDFRLQAEHFEQLVDVRLFRGGHFDVDHFAAHRFDLDFVLQQVGAHAVRLGIGFVDLVDGDNDRHLRRLGVVDRFDCLRHHAIVGGDNQHDDIGDFGAARTHGGEGGVARCIDECDLGARWRGHLIGADMLGDAAGFARRHVGRPNGIEQRRLAVVDVTHHGDDRRARRKLRRIVGDVEQAFFHVGFGHATHAVAHFLGDQLGRVGIDHVVDRHHLALASSADE